MPKELRKVVEDLRVRAEQGRERFHNYRARRGTSKRAITLMFGAALSVGGAAEAFEGVRYLVEKDLDRVKVVQTSPRGEKVVADMQGKFVANSIYKVARAVPDSFVAQQSNLFDPSWLRFDRETAADAKEKLSLVTDAVSQEFFKTLPFGSIIHEKARKYDVDPALVAAVIEQESRFKLRARSHRGAMGLMQLMPRTGRWMGAKNLYDAEQNVDAGVKYLAYLDKRFKGNRTKIIAAYNAGEGTVKRYGGIPPYRETRTYVKKVFKNYEKRQKQLEEFGEKYAEEQELSVGR
jgi:hypothetical protein